MHNLDGIHPIYICKTLVWIEACFRKPFCFNTDLKNRHGFNRLKLQTALICHDLVPIIAG